MYYYNNIILYALRTYIGIGTVAPLCDVHDVMYVISMIMICAERRFFYSKDTRSSTAHQIVYTPPIHIIYLYNIYTGISFPKFSVHV